MNHQWLIDLKRKFDMLTKDLSLERLRGFHIPRTEVIKPALPYRDHLRMPSEFKERAVIKGFVSRMIRMESDCRVHIFRPFNERYGATRGSEVCTDHNATNFFLSHAREKIFPIFGICVELYVAMRIEIFHQSHPII